MIAENVKNTQEKIVKACIGVGRDPHSVSLIGVSKTFGAAEVAEAVQSGLYDIGENYVQEAREKQEALNDKRIRWHFIGHLQTNKVKYIAEWIYMIHSVDSVGLAQEINNRAERAARIIQVLLEVNTSGETTKFGVEPEKAVIILQECSNFKNVRVAGLMTIGRFSPDPEASRPAFRLLRTIFDKANASGFLREPMSHLSMGMSHDFRIAIQEGATMVRIGTAIFGSRKKK